MKKEKDKANAGVKEIARRAKVSIATVDRVIHNRPGVSEKTKELINSIIRELNYQPNVLAQRLALASRGILRLAVLLPAISEETEFWQAPLDGVTQAENEIRQYNVHVERFLFDQNDPLSFARQVKKIEQQKPDGLLFTPTFPEESVKLIRSCEKADMPYVLINADIPGVERRSYIGPELFHSGYLAGQLVNYCTNPGEPVLLVNIAKEIAGNHAILRKDEGFRAFFEEHDKDRLIIQLHTTQTDYASVSQKLNRVFQKEHRPRAIYVTNSRVSLVAKWLDSKKIKDVLLLGYDFLRENVEYLEKGAIDFLICEKPHEQGYKGMMSLFQKLVYNVEQEKTLLMPIDIITRENYRFYHN
ncbi:MAG: LacI family DNA-binding transcriptional regulator [Chitinophagaceae bacterium]|nr:LacI family DNA-binding transcriptional regulator [Chitinophagaceae bacterium]